MNTTVTQAADDILSMFKTGWEVPDSAADLGGGTYVPVYWPNVDTDGPTDVAAEWVRITFINSGTGRHAGIGSGTGRYKKVGAVIFQVFVEKGMGPDRSNALVQQIVDVFDGKTSTNGVLFTDTAIEVIGADQGWWNVNTTVDFEFSEFK